MNEKEQLKQAKEQLKESIKVVRRDLKLYGRAVVNRNNVILKNVSNNVISFFKKFTDVKHLSNLNKRKSELDKESEKIEDEIKKTVERIQKEEEIENKLNDKKADRKLNLKEDAKQKSNSKFSRFGKIKNSILNKIRLSNIDVKIRNALDLVQVWALGIVNKGVSSANKVKDGISNYTSDQIANYYLWKYGKQEEKELKLHKKRLAASEMMAEQQIRERTEEHKRNMIELFDEQDEAIDDVLDETEQEVKYDSVLDAAEYEIIDVEDDNVIDDIQNEIVDVEHKNIIDAAEYEIIDVEDDNVIDEIQSEELNDSNDVLDNVEETNADRKLNLNDNVKQKASSFKSKLGKVKNSFLKSLNMSNADVKIRNAFDHVQVWGLSTANKGMVVLNKTKDGVVNFTSEQIAKYSEWRMAKQIERQNKKELKEHEKRLLEAEKMSEQQIKERTLEHKKGMTDAFNAREREDYDIKHTELVNKKQELIKNLIEEKNKLFNKTSNNEETQEKSKVRINRMEK